MFARKQSGKNPGAPEGSVLMSGEHTSPMSGSNASDFPLVSDPTEAPRAVFGKKGSSADAHHAASVPHAPATHAPITMESAPLPSTVMPPINEWDELAIATPPAAPIHDDRVMTPPPAPEPVLEPLTHLKHAAGVPSESGVLIPRDITRAPLQEDEMTEAALKAIAEAVKDEPEQAMPVVKTKPVGRGIKKAEIALDLGIIAPLMRDDTISDILINGAGPIYVERAGMLEATRLKFNSEEEVVDFAARILAVLEREIDPLRPLVDARMPDGSRVNIIMPPMAVDGTTISIRKFPAHKITLDTMVEAGMITEGIGNFLKACGHAKINMIISGGTGAGKTTLLNSLSQFISHKERIVTIEDSAELQLQQPHVVRLETKRPTRQGRTDEEVNIRDLVINSLRMRPDRIIVGEVRGGEAFDMLQAMNTGHEGSMATLHANTPRDALSRLENMINMADMGLSQKFIRQQICSALTIIIQISRFRDGTRRITHITEVVGLENEIVVMQDLFTFHVKGEDENGRIIGQYEWGNIIPRCKELSEVARSSGLFTNTHKR